MIARRDLLEALLAMYDEHPCCGDLEIENAVRAELRELDVAAMPPVATPPELVVGARVRFIKPGAAWTGREGVVVEHDPSSLCEWVVLLDGDDLVTPFGAVELEVTESWAPQ